MERGGLIYIMTNKNKTTFYVGVTSDLLSRIIEHKSNKFPNSFTSRYNLTYCVYFEACFTIEEAIYREKQVRKYRREKKIALVESINPNWDDLSIDIYNW
ncbi:GIY-YIG nuclease superfamily protein [compost metagenome]